MKSPIFPVIYLARRGESARKPAYARPFRDHHQSRCRLLNPSPPYEGERGSDALAPLGRHRAGLTAGRFRQRIPSSRAQPPGTEQELFFYLPVAWDSESGRSPGTVYALGDPTWNANVVAAS